MRHATLGRIFILALSLLIVGLGLVLFAQTARVADPAAVVTVAGFTLLVAAGVGAGSQDDEAIAVAVLSAVGILVNLVATFVASRWHRSIRRWSSQSRDDWLQAVADVAEAEALQKRLPRSERRELAATIAEAVQLHGIDDSQRAQLIERLDSRELLAAIANAPPDPAGTAPRVAAWTAGWSPPRFHGSSEDCLPRLRYGGSLGDIVEHGSPRRSYLATTYAIEANNHQLRIEVKVIGRTWRGLPMLRRRSLEVKAGMAFYCERDGDACAIEFERVGTWEADGDGLRIIVDSEVTQSAGRCKVELSIRTALNPKGGPGDTQLGVPGIPVKQSWSWASADHNASVQAGTYVWRCDADAAELKAAQPPAELEGDDQAGLPPAA